MARNTLMRHRRSLLINRDPNEGGGGGTETGGTGTEGGAGSGTETGGNTGGGTSTDSGKTFTQAELDQIVSTRLARQKAQFADYDTLKAEAAEAARLRQEQETASEKAVREAREAAVAEERAKSAPRLVGAEFRAAAKGVLTDAQRDAFLEDADLTKYLTDKGEVDVAKVEAKVKALAPEKPEPKGRVPRDMGQGNRSEGGKASVSSSREDYLERRRKQLSGNK